jgi:NADPH:quinone reductase-like Zn-dependent oxidoreductase
MGQATMRGWTYTARGRPAAVLKLRDDLPRPTAADLRPDEVLVKVSHVGLFQGFAVMMGMIPHMNQKPWIPANDFSGTVEATGSKVTNVRPGDAVFGGPDPKLFMRWGSRYNGMLVEYAVLPAAQVVRKPDNISLAAAATVPGNGCTAVQFVALAKMKKGDRVLITAASGGLGTVMVQVARAVVGKEGLVVGSCSAPNEELVKKLGADEVSLATSCL